MTFIFLALSLSAVFIYIIWVLFKPKKKHIKKRVGHKKKLALKNKSTSKKQDTRTQDQIPKQHVEQMKNDPEVISRVVRHWLNER